MRMPLGIFVFVGGYKRVECRLQGGRVEVSRDLLQNAADLITVFIGHPFTSTFPNPEDMIAGENIW